MVQLGELMMILELHRQGLSVTAKYDLGVAFEDRRNGPKCIMWREETMSRCDARTIVEFDPLFCNIVKSWVTRAGGSFPSRSNARTQSPS